MLNRLAGVILSFSLFQSNLFGTPENYYGNTKEGYYFYKKDQASLDKNVSRPKIPKDLTSLSAEDFQKLLESVKSYAVMNPSEDNIKSYLKLQAFAIKQSEKFQKVWQKTIIENPDMNYASNTPNSSYSNIALSAEEDEARKSFYDKYSKNLGFTVFFKDGDKRLNRTKVIFDAIKNETSIGYIFVNESDNPKAFAQYGVRNTPDIFLVIRTKDGSLQWNRVATGLATKTEILDNMHFLVKQKLQRVIAE